VSKQERKEMGEESAIESSIGKSFPPAMRYAGMLSIVLGGLSIYLSPLLGLIVVLLGLFLTFTTQKVRVNIQDNSIKLYHSLFGIESGKSHSLDAFAYLSVLSSKVVTRVQSRAGVFSESSADNFFDVYLLSKTHRNKVLLARFKVRNEAEVKAKEFSLKLKREVVIFNPQLSQSSSQKRRRRRS
jgi:hypothetical protein